MNRDHIGAAADGGHLNRSRSRREATEPACLVALRQLAAEAHEWRDQDDRLARVARARAARRASRGTHLESLAGPEPAESARRGVQ